MLNRKMKSNLSIVYLWAEITGYVHAVLSYLAQQVDAVDVVHWDRKGINSSRYESWDGPRLRFYGRTVADDDRILAILEERKPAIIVVSGWMDAGYIAVCRKYKRTNEKVKIVCGIDDQWTGSLRQYIGILYYRLFYRKLFDYMWVSGAPQFSFAQRFGYGINTIVMNLYSADTSLFNERASICRRFLYVGRFIKIKAPDLLLSAYLKLPAETQKQWPIVFIGDGELKDALANNGNSNVLVLPFMQPHDLQKELLNGGVACMPSHKDQWGVAIHEYALMGLPLLLSSGVGAATEFLIGGYNGYMFHKSDMESLFSNLLCISKLTNSELEEFSKNSTKLGSRITVETSAYSLLSILKD
jgi:glycosyltransferase involved in cell wall biosynthesis